MVSVIPLEKKKTGLLVVVVVVVRDYVCNVMCCG